MFTLGELAQRLGLAIEGDEARSIVGLAALAEAGPDQISFLSSSRHQNQLNSTRAGAIIITRELRQYFAGDALVSENPYLSFAHASALFDARPGWEAGLHPTAVVHSTCTLGQSVSIGANCTIGADVKIGDGVIIGPGC